MERTIEIGIPSKNWTLPGLLHLVPAARAGVILIGEPGGGLRGPADIYDELALYLQASGFSTLQMEYLHPNSLADCTYDILGALSSLHTWGVERAVLVIWSSAEPDAATMDGKRNTSIEGTAIARVVDAIVGMVGIVVGVATIVARPNRRRSATRSGRPRRLHLIRDTRADASAASSFLVPLPRPSSPPALTVCEDTSHRLTLSLQDDADHSRYAGTLITKLYAWSCSVLHEGAATRSVPKPIPLQRRRDMPMRALRGSIVDELPNGDSTKEHALSHDFTTAQIWLDHQWRDILGGLEARDPGRGAQARHRAASVPHTDPGHSRRIAAHIWPQLDFEARANWLQACWQAHHHVEALTHAKSAEPPHIIALDAHA